MWRQWNDVNRVEAFELILDEIGKYYPADDLASLFFFTKNAKKKLNSSG